jgi:hypothetical protein
MRSSRFFAKCAEIIDSNRGENPDKFAFGVRILHNIIELLVRTKGICRFQLLKQGK